MSNDELKAEIAKALHIDWAFKDVNGKPTRIIIEGTPKGAYHTSYDLFVDDIVKLINSESLKLLDRLESKTVTNEWFDEDMVMTNGDFIPLSAIQEERKQYKGEL